MLIECDMVGPRKKIEQWAEHYQLAIESIKNGPNGYDVRLKGTRENIKLFYERIMYTGETFDEWLEYSAVIENEDQLTNIFIRSFVFAYDKYKKAAGQFREISDVPTAEEAKWDDVFSHIQLAQEALARKA